MLRLISKQAQLLTVNDDAALMQPYRQIGQGVKRYVKNRAREKQRLQWEKQRSQWKKQRNYSIPPHPPAPV